MAFRYGLVKDLVKLVLCSQVLSEMDFLLMPILLSNYSIY